MTSSPTPPSAQPFPSGTGRYAPSPSGDLHLGNLRTAILAWAMARRGGKPFYLRVEDLDRVRQGAAERQIADLAALGLDWDASPGAPTERVEGAEIKEAGVLYQSTRLAAYEQAVAQLREANLVYGRSAVLSVRRLCACVPSARATRCRMIFTAPTRGWWMILCWCAMMAPTPIT